MPVILPLEEHCVTYRPTRRDLIGCGLGGVVFTRLARGQQVRIPGPGGGTYSAGSGGGGGTFSLVAHVAASSGSGGDATTGAINTGGANLIVVGVAMLSTNPAIQDNKGNTWSRLTVQTAGSNFSEALFYCYAPSVGSGHTFNTNNGSNNYPSICVAAFSGSAASPLDQLSGSSATTTLSIQPGSITPGQDSELSIAFLGCNNSESSMTVNAGFSVTDSQLFVSGKAYGCAMGYLIQTTAAAVNPTWTVAPNNANLVTTIASFK